MVNGFKKLAKPKNGGAILRAIAHGGHALM